MCAIDLRTVARANRSRLAVQVASLIPATIPADNDGLFWGAVSIESRRAARRTRPTWVFFLIMSAQAT
jgi:hypothetical protein